MALALSCNNPPTGFVGIAYSHAFLATGGTEPYTFGISAGSLPTGLVLDPSTGMIAPLPLPSQKGIFDFTVQVTDDDDATAEADCSIQIVGACLLEGQVPVGE